MQLVSTITCLSCGHGATETMLVQAPRGGGVLKPKVGACWLLFAAPAKLGSASSKSALS